MEPVPGFEDFIRRNDVVPWPEVPGLINDVETMEKAQQGRPPRIGHQIEDPEPHRFYVQIKARDLYALQVPPKVQPFLVNTMQLQHQVAMLPLRIGNLCEYDVQL